MSKALISVGFSISIKLYWVLEKSEKRFSKTIFKGENVSARKVFKFFTRP